MFSVLQQPGRKRKRSTQQHVLRARNSTANSFSQARITYNRAGKRKTHTVSSSPEKKHMRIFFGSDPKNTSVFLVFNWRHIRAFGFYSKNTSAFFLLSKNTCAFYCFPKCETQKNTEKTLNKTSLFQGLEPDPNPDFGSPGKLRGYKL